MNIFSTNTNNHTGDNLQNRICHCNFFCKVQSKSGYQSEYLSITASPPLSLSPSPSGTPNSSDVIPLLHAYQRIRLVVMHIIRYLSPPHSIPSTPPLIFVIYTPEHHREDNQNSRSCRIHTGNVFLNSSPALLWHIYVACACRNFSLFNLNRKMI